MLFAQITDTHIGSAGLAPSQARPDAMLEKTVEKLNALETTAGRAVDAVIATGDLANWGKPEEYDRLREILEDLKAPLFLLAGNHDLTERLREAFPGHDYLPARGPLDYTVGVGDLRLICLDTSLGDQIVDHGELAPGQLEWLETELSAAPDRPTLVALHHPPFATGIPQFDAIGLMHPEPLKTLLARHPQVVHIVAGHVHRPIKTRFAGRPASIAPSTAFTYPLAFERDVVFNKSDELTGFQLHLWTGTDLITHTVRTGVSSPS